MVGNWILTGLEYGVKALAGTVVFVLGFVAITGLLAFLSGLFGGDDE